ncbi:hypothetical protein HU200_038499 [Digitaria exilis]|uniref:Uncharacterized protein n=1 Tax=Digitaria exilis TaxID=1010633 RepID=A0A835EIB5_9POAL|nr:hypothetical protein HU200_038499 [Digitaria exilis]
MRASCAVPEDFPKDVVWNWEFNEEFERYLPTYMKMLEEVDAMDDCLEDNYLEEEILLEKLKPEFKSRYGINSYMHPYVHTMSSMLQPYLFHLQRTDSWDSVYKRLREAHKDLLKTIACQLALADKSVPFEPLEPQLNDFMEHLRPYARMYIERKRKEFGLFFVACLMVYALPLAPGPARKDTFQSVRDLVKSQFSGLEDDLIAMSFEVLFTWTFDFSC